MEGIQGRERRFPQPDEGLEGAKVRDVTDLELEADADKGFRMIDCMLDHVQGWK
jgi:hypothetical protein